MAAALNTTAKVQSSYEKYYYYIFAVGLEKYKKGIFKNCAAMLSIETRRNRYSIIIFLWKKYFPLESIISALGLNLGELTALAAAEVYDFEVGLQIVAERGRLMKKACDEFDGDMASVLGGTREQVAKLAEEFNVDVANLNCPGQIVISGASDRIAEAVKAGKGRGFKPPWKALDFLRT